MRLFHNPLFRRDMALSGPAIVRLLRLPTLCVIALAAWLVILAVSLLLSLQSDRPVLRSDGMWLGLIVGGRIGLSGPVLFLIGCVVGYWRFSRDRRSRLFEHLYFAALDSREIVQAKVAALIFSLCGLYLAVVLSTAGASALLLVAHVAGGGGGRSIDHMPIAALLINLFVGIFRSGPALVGGILGGMRLAILTRPGHRFGELLLQFLMFVLSFCWGALTLLNLTGYVRVVNEFWWHVVYLDQEVDWDRRRL